LVLTAPKILRVILLKVRILSTTEIEISRLETSRFAAMHGIQADALRRSTLPKTNSLPLKMDAWKIDFLIRGWPMFRGVVHFWCQKKTLFFYKKMF